MSRFRIIPQGEDRWEVERKAWLGWDHYSSNFRSEKEAEDYIDGVLATEEDIRRREKAEAFRASIIAPREYP